MKTVVWRDIGITFLLTMVILAILYPDQLVHGTRRFMISHDTELHEENLFLLIQHFFQGGVQLYNRFDQMSNVYNLMTAGMYSVIDMVLAAIYLVLNPLSQHSGELLHKLYSIGFYTGAAVLRILGGYLLLRKFTQNRLAIIIALVYFNVFLSSQLINRGMHVNNLYSYLPLLFYFILNFFENFKLKDLCLAGLVLAIAIANSPFFALSYFYVVVHFFVISCAIVYFVYPLRHKKEFYTRMFKGWFSHVNLKQALVIGIVMILLILPYLLMNGHFKHDFFIANSGLNGTQGRLQGMGIADYFSFPGRSYAHPLQFLLKAFDFSETRWGSNWMFIGFSAFFLIIAGIILSKQRLKHTIVWLSIFMFSLNIPSNPKDIFAFAHWINVLTNPLHFLDRSFHMAALLWYFALFPLIALGMEAILAIVKRNYSAIYKERIGIALGFFIGLTVLFMYLGPVNVQRYLLLQSAIVFMFFFLFWTKDFLQKKWLALMLGIIFIGIDLLALRHYINQDLDDQVHLKPRVYTGLMSKAPQVLDFQNPNIFPQRLFYRTNQDPVEPAIQTYQHAFGAFYSHTPLIQRFVRPAYLYEPRPMAFKGLYDDKTNAAYLKKDGRILFFAPYAMDQDKVSMSALLENNLDRQVVLFDKDTPNLTDPSIAIKPAALPGVGTQNFMFDLNKAKKKSRIDNIEYTLDLPSGFPAYVATSLFTQDFFTLELFVGNSTLEPAQGHLINTYTFDVQNIKKGKLSILLPKELDVKDKQARLSLRQFDDITHVWRNTHDAWGFDYKAPANGWIVFHYPYDAKWQILIDGKKEKLYRANQYYMAAYVTEGERRILLQYWPGSILRILLFLSAILSIAALAYVIWEGYRRER